MVSVELNVSSADCPDVWVTGLFFCGLGCLPLCSLRNRASKCWLLISSQKDSWRSERYLPRSGEPTVVGKILGRHQVSFMRHLEKVGLLAQRDAPRLNKSHPWNKDIELEVCVAIAWPASHNGKTCSLLNTTGPGPFCYRY